MKKLASLFVALFSLVWLTGAGWLPLAATGGGTVFTGPGDVVSGATAWYGLRAYSTADRGNKLVNVCDPANVTCADWLSDALTGKLVATTNPLNGTDCTVSTTCTLKTFYDRSGANSCAGAVPCDATQATAANRPTLTWSCINSLPCAVFNGTSDVLQSPVFTAASTSTISAVVNRAGNFTATGPMFTYGSTSGNVADLQFRAVASAVQMFNGTSGQFISNITDSNFHTFQGVFNGASSVLFCGGGTGTSCSVAGVSNAISPGTLAPTTASQICIGEGNTANNCVNGAFFTGQLTEVGLWATTNTTFNGTQLTNMTANQYTFWGPF